MPFEHDDLDLFEPEVSSSEDESESFWGNILADEALALTGQTPPAAASNLDLDWSGLYADVRQVAQGVLEGVSQALDLMQPNAPFARKWEAMQNGTFQPTAADRAKLERMNQAPASPGTGAEVPVPGATTPTPSSDPKPAQDGAVADKPNAKVEDSEPFDVAKYMEYKRLHGAPKAGSDNPGASNPDKQLPELDPAIEIATKPKYDAIKGTRGADGTFTARTEDGATLSHRADGSAILERGGERVKVSPTGQMIITRNGVEEHFHPESAKQEALNDGGSMRYSYSDGTTVVLRNPNGRFEGLTIQRADGTGMQTSSETPALIHQIRPVRVKS
jgi:hypothetical protein